jgi:hypothetical protein
MRIFYRLTSCLAAILCLTFSAVAQKYIDFQFEEDPNFELTNEQKEKDELILVNTYSVEFVVTEMEEYQYTFNHTVTWVNSDDAIKRNNRIYVAARENSEYLFQRARVIKPSGEIKVLNEKDIKEGVFEETGNKYYYYALEGLEKGSIIESCSYQKLRPPRYYGKLIYLQGKTARVKQSFELIAPQHLGFAFKSMNGLPEVQKDSLTTDKNRWFLEVDSVEKILDQPSFYVDVVKQAVLYKLDRNIATGVQDITSYGSVASNIYNNLHPELDKALEKELKKILKEINLKELENLEEKARAIDRYIKSNYQIVESYEKGLSDLQFILDNKAANASGATSLYIALLDLAEIKHEIVITTDRSELRFDPEFEAYLFLDNYLLYLPEIKKYITPGDQFMPLGIIPSLYTNNYGLFIKGVKVGDFESAVGKVKFIDPLPYTASIDKMKIDVDFSESTSTPLVTIEKESTGYAAAYLQPYFYLLDEEETESMNTFLVESIHEDMKADNIEVLNVAQNDFGVKPFIYRFSTSEHSFVEKAGSDLLFKVGELIGPQVEMYQENERQFDVESDHNRAYYRTISFSIPEGYELENPEALSINYAFEKEGKQHLLFKSSYSKEGQRYTVECEEFYANIINDIEEFDDFKKVVNAAADFNKIVLILKKKN